MFLGIHIYLYLCILSLYQEIKAEYTGKTLLPRVNPRVNMFDGLPGYKPLVSPAIVSTHNF